MVHAIHVVRFFHVAVLLIPVQIVQLSHQARLFQIQILSVLSEEVASDLKMEFSLNYGSLPKPSRVLKITTLDPLQSTGWDQTNVVLKASTEKHQAVTYQEKLRFPKLPST
jgi:hypothetical protein